MKEKAELIRLWQHSCTLHATYYCYFVLLMIEEQTCISKCFLKNNNHLCFIISYKRDIPSDKKYLQVATSLSTIVFLFTTFQSFQKSDNYGTKEWEY